MYLEILIVLALICLNGLLAMAELAIVSARPVRLKLRAEKGEKGATTAIRLAQDSGRFLASAQIGISLVGVLSGAFSGATLGLRLGSVLLDWGVPETIAQPVGIGIVVVVITYLSLILGELVPKQLALRAPETVAMKVAPLMLLISKGAAPLIWLLDGSGKLVLRLIRQSGSLDAAISDEEIHMVIDEAAGAGVIEQEESRMIAGVMRTADRTARGVLTPRHEVEIADARETRQQILERFRRSGHSRLPLRDGGPDDLVGVINARDVLTDQKEGAFDALALLKPAPIIHDSLPAIAVIDKLRNSEVHMLLVFDEYGHFEGVVTPMDILGAIAGGFDSDRFDEPKIIERDDGSMLVAGWMPVDEFTNQLGIVLEDDPLYETVAGLVLDQAKTLPNVGQSVKIDGWTLEIVDMDGRRIDKLLVSRTVRNPDNVSPDV